MKLFGLEIKKARIEQKSFYLNSMYFNSGEDLTKGMYTYFHMYRMNADIRRCVEELEQTVCKGGYSIGNYKDGELIPVSNKNIDIAINNSSFYEFKNDIIQSLEITGNVFIYKRKNFSNSTIGYRVLDTRYMTIVADNNDEVVRYMYREATKGGISVVSYMPDEIFHYKQTRDPDNKLFGISKLETLVYDVFSDEEGAISNFYSFKNGSIPSAIIKLKEGITAEQEKQIFEQIKIGLTGSHNKNKLLASEWIEKVEILQKTHTDMDFQNQRKFTTEKVCAVMGVPKIVLNYTDGVNYTNADVQYTKYIENTIRPYEKTIEIIINSLIREFDNDIVFVVNDKHIDDLEEKHKATMELIKNGVITRNEARIFLGFNRYEEEYMDDITVQANTVLLEVVAGDPLTQEENTSNDS